MIPSSPGEFLSHGAKVELELFKSSSAKVPAVVVVYGTEEMQDPYGKLIRSFASDLAGRGYVVLIPHHFRATGVTGGSAAYNAFSAKRDDWITILSDAVRYAGTRDDVKDGRVGM